MMLMMQEGPRISGADPRKEGPGGPIPKMFLSGGQIDVSKLARESYAAVYRFCVVRLGADHAADAAQETFITAHRVSKSYRGDAKPLTWLFGIAHNECRRLMRQNRLLPAALEFETEIASTSDEMSLINREALSQALVSLSSEHRDVVLLHEIEGLTYDEIASVLAIPVGTVKSRLHHAFQNLRKSFCVADHSSTPTERTRK